MAADIREVITNKLRELNKNQAEYIDELVAANEQLKQEREWLLNGWAEELKEIDCNDNFTFEEYREEIIDDMRQALKDSK